LEGRRGTDGGIEGDIVGFTVGWAGLDITASLTLGVCVRPAPGMLAG